MTYNADVKPYSHTHSLAHHHHHQHCHEQDQDDNERLTKSAITHQPSDQLYCVARLARTIFRWNSVQVESVATSCKLWTDFSCTPQWSNSSSRGLVPFPRRWWKLRCPAGNWWRCLSANVAWTCCSCHRGFAITIVCTVSLHQICVHPTDIRPWVTSVDVDLFKGLNVVYDVHIHSETGCEAVHSPIGN